MFLYALHFIQALWLSGLRAAFQRGTPRHFDLQMKLPFIKAKTLIRLSQSLFYLLKLKCLGALLKNVHHSTY